VPIHSSRGQLISVIETIQDLSERKRMEETLTRLASTDPLTDVYNRGRIEELLRQEIARAGRYGQPFAVLLLDLDYFKKVNDRFGHSVGDTVLKEIAAAVQRQLRETDALGRWGGEEFLVLCPGTGQEEAVAIAERLRRLVEGLAFGVTISCGLTEYRHGDTVDVLINRADRALYGAKRDGRNTVRLAAA
jgi:diguanylate cyclase (GGDEF)-like protein